jgi:hypothetical protein
VVISRFKGDLVLLDSGACGDESGPAENPLARRQTHPASAPPRGGPAWDTMRGGDLDDEIPF